MFDLKFIRTGNDVGHILLSEAYDAVQTSVIKLIMKLKAHYHAEGSFDPNFPIQLYFTILYDKLDFGIHLGNMSITMKVRIKPNFFI